MSERGICEHVGVLGVKIHTLPCRHELCIACTKRITGLWEGHLFTCPKCGNYSQYVDPDLAVTGVSKGRSRRDPLPEDDNRNSSQHQEYSEGRGAMHGVTKNESIQSVTDDNANSSDSLPMSPEERREQQEYYREHEREWKRSCDPTFHHAMGGRPCGSDAPGGYWQSEWGLPASTRSDGESSETEYWRLTEENCGSQRLRSGNHNIPDIGGSEALEGGRQNMNADQIEATIQRQHELENDIHGRAPGEDKMDTSEPPATQDGGHRKQLTDDDAHCTSHPLSAIHYFCNTCNSQICGKCIAEKHKKHAFIKLIDACDHPTNLTKGSKCQKHLRPAVLYCKQCNVMVCKICSDEKEHNHVWDKPKPLNDVKNKLRDKFFKLRDENQNNLQHHEKVCTAMESDYGKVLDKSENLKQQVEKATRAAIEKIEMNKTRLIELIEQDTKDKLTAREEYKKKVDLVGQDLSDINAIIDNAFRQLDEGDIPLGKTAEEEIGQRLIALKKMTNNLHQPREDYDMACTATEIPNYDSYNAPVKIERKHHMHPYPYPTGFSTFYYFTTYHT